MSAAGFRHSVREVVLLASSSRGGSSLFAEILRRLPGLLHFHGEINPFLRLADLAYPLSGADSDRLDESHAAPGPRTDALELLLERDCGVPMEHWDRPGLRDRLREQMAWRLAAQWPELRISAAHLDDALRQFQRQSSLAEAHLGMLLDLRKHYPAIDPYYYDIPRDLVQRLAPEIPFPDGPASEQVVEEPPFITAPPSRDPSPGELSSWPLVIKTPSNAYRFGFLRRFFPRARLRVLHLTRNAAASINGLVDGWRHLGFHSHRMPGRLAIHGYTDALGPHAADWWKFDLPPGWQDYTHRPLTEVCAFQWRSAHEATLGEVEKRGLERLHVRFEDVLDPAARPPVLAGVARWLGVELESGAAERLFSELPVMMATERPRHRRWLEKAELLEPVLACGPVRETMQRLGYDEQPSTWL